LASVGLLRLLRLSFWWLLVAQVAAVRSQVLEPLVVVVAQGAIARSLLPTFMALHIPSLLGLVERVLQRLFWLTAPTVPIPFLPDTPLPAVAVVAALVLLAARVITACLEALAVVVVGVLPLLSGALATRHPQPLLKATTALTLVLVV
jgi:hypothetical protein